MFAKIKNADILKRSAEIPKRGWNLPICIYSRKSTFTKKYSKKKTLSKLPLNSPNLGSKSFRSILRPVLFLPSRFVIHIVFSFFILLWFSYNHRQTTDSKTGFKIKKACENRLFSSIFLSMICFTDEIQF